MSEMSSNSRQVVGSLIAAVLLIVVTVILVTAKIGPGLDSTELREKEERQEQRQEEREERQEERLED